jgi:hypothetical protein
MAKTPSSSSPTMLSQKRFAGGISDSLKESANGQIPNAYYFGRAVNYRDDPQAITLLPGTVKESGSVITDLLKWGDIVPTTLKTYFYGNAGAMYSRSTAASWTKLFTAASSHGNGLGYFFADDYLYYTTDSSLGRYGPTQSASPQSSDNFLRAQGGVPQNTASLSLASASSMYGTAADSASLSVTGNITLEAFFKATTLPTVGNSMTLIGKWDENANTRSYKLDLSGVSGFFGSGTDGSLTISVDSTDAPIDSACTGTIATQSLVATNASFASGQIILIHQSQGTNAGQWERNTIQGYTAGTITLQTPLIGTYTTGAQVRVVPQYTNLTVNAGITYKPKDWNGTVGGILAFLVNGTLTVANTGSISANGTNGATLTGQQIATTTVGGGFFGGKGVSSAGQNHSAFCGEGTSGPSVALGSSAANGNGGGAGFTGIYNGRETGGGGGNGTTGTPGGGSHGGGATAGIGGGVSGSTDLTSMVFGGGGGGTTDTAGTAGCSGGSGGAIIFITATTLTNLGAITANGGNSGINSNQPDGGGGAGGSILLKVQTATLGTGTITANGGTATFGGGLGGVGRIDINYLTSYTGTTSPTLNTIQDNTLVTTTTYQARLGISNDGTAFEYLTQNLPTLTTGVWNRLSVSWIAASSMATFYLNALAIGTSTGTKTSIANTVVLLYVGADKGASVVGDFFNGLLDDIRIWSNAQTAGQIYANNLIQLTGKEAGVAAYYELNSAYTDTGPSGNTITPHNSPTFSADVPFPAPTTRLDIDTQSTATGDIYTLLTAISEGATDTLSFTPVNDPQASVGFYVDTKGTGDWTVTVHDQQNNVIATQTIVNANLPSSGFVEFIFTTPWRIVIGKTYHMHLTVSTGTSKVVASSNENFSTAEYATYFGFLVTDTQFHPIKPFLNFIAIGNERYIAKWDGAFYTPNAIAFPSGWKVRCFAYWREYMVVGMWRGGNIYDFDAGRVYFWDGIAPTFNFFIDVPEGQINAMFGVDSDLYMFAGYRGNLLDYQGGYFYNTGNTKSNKLRRIPLIATSDNTEVYPGALTMWRGLLHFGAMAAGTSSTIQRGVYSYGTLNQYYPDTLSYDYVLSTGNTGSTVAIGLTYPVGKNLIVGWQDGIAFGADVVNFNNNPASSGELKILLQDDGTIWHESVNFKLRADVLPLQTGESVDVKFAIDRPTSFTVSPVDSTIGDTKVEFPISAGRGREYQVGVDLYATGSTSPTLLGLTALRNPLNEEQVI